jgi:hypothetical protein
MQVTKYVLPVVIGAMSGMILITRGEMVIHNMYPLPPGTDLYDTDSLAKAIKLMPTSAFLFLLANYILCSFLAGIITSLVANRTASRPAFIVGIVLTLAGLYNVVALPQPVWFSVLNLLVYLPLCYLGYLTVRKKAIPQ